MVAIVILNWNGIELTRECLESLGKCTYPNRLVIVVDNDSEKKPGSVLGERFPSVEFIHNDSNLGFAEGNNVGIRAALEKGADYVMLLNNDTEVDGGFLEPLVSAMEENPGLGAVSPLILFAEPREMIWFAGSFPILFGIHGKRLFFRERIENYPHKAPYEVKALSGCAFFFRRNTLEQLGLLDADYFTYCEDTDYSHRLMEAGKKMAIIPSSRIWHKVSASTGGSNNPASLYLMGRGRVIFLKKHAPWYAWLLFAPFAVGQLLMDFRRGGIQSVKARLRGYQDGLSEKLRIPRA